VTVQIPPDIDGQPITSQAEIDAAGLPGSASGTSFLGMNLLCPAGLPWQPAPETLKDQMTVNGEKVTLAYPVKCASSPVERVPYYVFALLMFGTTYYQQRQMQKASPPGAASQQQQAILKIMPIMFGVFGIFFPAGLVVYWTTSNLWQIGQQYYMLRTRPTAEALAAGADGKKTSEKKGLMSSMMERAERERKRRDTGTGRQGSTGSKPGSPKPGSGSSRRKPGSGGSGGGDPKKRPKR
jgi:OXA1/YqjG-like inner membrane protein